MAQKYYTFSKIHLTILFYIFNTSGLKEPPIQWLTTKEDVGSRIIKNLPHQLQNYHIK